MEQHIRGLFDVTLAPQHQDAADGVALARLSIDKQFHGDLDATSKGEMLSVRADGGAAAYVAIERVTGTLSGRSGSFVLIHNGVMSSETQQLTITVAPDSGTGELHGLAGTMNISFEGDQHIYEFIYTLP